LITSGYALVLLLVVVRGILTISGINSLQLITSDIYAHPFKSTNAALEAEDSIARTRIRLFLILMFDDPQKVEGWLSEIQALDADAKEQLDGLRTSFLGDTRQVDEAENLLRQWQEIRNRAIELSVRGQRGDATRLIMESSVEKFAQLSDSLDYIIDYARHKATAYVDEAERKAATERNWTVWSFIGLVVAIVSICWVVVRRVMLMVRYVEQLEKDLLESRHKAETAAYTRSLIEVSIDPLVTISPGGKVTDVNRATEQVTGRSRDELVGTDFADYFTEPDKAREGYQRVFLEGSVIDYPLTIRHREDRITEVLYNASLYRDGAGKVLGCLPPRVM